MDRLVQAVANWENCFQKEWVVLREVGGRGNVKRVDGWVGYEDFFLGFLGCWFMKIREGGLY